MLYEVVLDFQNPLAADKELTGKGETSAALNDAEIDEFIEKNKITNTAKKTKSDLNLI